jgi:hypothetical protein
MGVMADEVDLPFLRFFNCDFLRFSPLKKAVFSPVFYHSKRNANTHFCGQKNK